MKVKVEFQKVMNFHRSKM